MKTKKWTEMFDELEAVDDMMLGIRIPYVKLFGENNGKRLKQFIASLISDILDEVSEEVIGFPDGIPDDIGTEILKQQRKALKIIREKYI